MKKIRIEHHHISSKSYDEIRSIDVYLDHDKTEVIIVDSYDPSNRVTICGTDWNQLVDEIRVDKIGKFAE